MNSPYDPISPGSSRRSSEASSINGQTGLPGLTVDDQWRLRAKYDEVTGKKTAWDMEKPSPVATPQPPPGEPSSHRRKSPNRFKFPGRTPLPHEVPGVENRRASDPVKANQKPDLNLPRHNSYSQIQRNQPLPLPNTMNSLKHAQEPMGPPQNYPSMHRGGVGGSGSSNHNGQWNQGPQQQQQQGIMGNNVVNNNNRNAMMGHGNTMQNNGMMGSMQTIQASHGIGGTNNMAIQNNTNMGPFSPPQSQQQHQQQQPPHHQQFHQRQQAFTHQQQTPTMQHYANQQQQQGMAQQQQQGQYNNNMSTSAGMNINSAAPSNNMAASYGRLSQRRGAVHAASFMDTQQTPPTQQQGFMNGGGSVQHPSHHQQQQYYNQGSSGRGGITDDQGGNMLHRHQHPTSMEMSAPSSGCNQVTSTVMDHNPMTFDPMDCDDPMASGLAALSTDGMDHVQQLIPDTVSPSVLMPPPPIPMGGGPMDTSMHPTSVTPMHATSVTPMHPTSITPVSNMVVSDMSSMLTSLAEENRYLNMMSPAAGI